MARSHVDHKDIVQFAEEKVNLPKEKADQHREQVNRLREKLESYLSKNPTFSLRRMLISGSLAKGTALRTLNDIDVAMYVSGSEAPSDVKSLLEYLAERLKTAFPNFKPEQVQAKTYSVTVSFRGTGLDVDVVPILYHGDKDWYGDLISQDDGSLLKTNIPYHISFMKKRKAAQQTHFAQVVRLVKYWVQHQKQQNKNFRFKSFMVELILAHLSDRGQGLSDYPEALKRFFAYVVESRLGERIVFTDYYPATATAASSDPAQIVDPVNPQNNVSRLYTKANIEGIVSAAQAARDAVDGALVAPTKQQTVECWKKVFGPDFLV